MKNLFSPCFILLFFLAHFSVSQNNIISTNHLAEQIMLGNYNPATFLPPVIINHPDTLSRRINLEISADSLKSYIVKLSTFRNRNTGADTTSNITGIGASRRWVYSKFEEFSAANNNRLIPSYLQFDLNICNVPRHRNIFAVLPGSDTTDKSIIIIEGHIDSRCEGVCDINCNAQGIEDNASGTALVMEMARVMSRFSFKHTLVFLVTIGEEQGLYGADAFADYTVAKNIKVKAVQNNDVIGGIICGQTSSPPSCPGLNNVDSTQVRLFSFGSFNSKQKSYCRFIKLQYKEQLLTQVSVPMQITIMSAEDRTGRSGDHVPFRQKGYAAMRFTSANEHGDAGVSNPNYTDRQHTTRDTLGVDTDNDLVVDSFFVDFNYLKRNAIINGNAAAMCAIGPKQPDFILSAAGQNRFAVTVTQQTQYLQYRVGVRTTSHDWDTVFTMTGTLTDTFNFSSPNNIVYVSIMSVDQNNIESVPSTEYLLNISSVPEYNPALLKGITLLQNHPNPFDESTYIAFLAGSEFVNKPAFITIRDLSGKLIRKIPVDISPGLNEILYEHGYGVTGIYIYSLEVNGETLGSRKMTFAN